MTTTKIKTSNITDGSITSEKLDTNAVINSLGYIPANANTSNNVVTTGKAIAMSIVFGG